MNGVYFFRETVQFLIVQQYEVRKYLPVDCSDRSSFFQLYRDDISRKTEGRCKHENENSGLQQWYSKTFTER